jgi:hypothetical protein
MKYHISRSHFVSMMWLKSLEANPGLPSPEEYGWKQDVTKESLVPVLMTLDPVPDICQELITCKCKAGCGTGRCNCKKHTMGCTLGCPCHQTCSNPYNPKNDYDEDSDMEV